MTQHSPIGQRWRFALVPLNLPHTPTPEMAEATLDVWRQIPAKLTEHTNRKSRVYGMTRDIKLFRPRSPISSVRLHRTSRTFPLSQQYAPSTAG